MTARKRKRSGSVTLDGKRATITVNRGGAEVVIHDVAAPQAFAVLLDMLEAFQGVEQAYPELQSYMHDHHGDYAPNFVFDDEGEASAAKPMHERPPTVAGFHS